MAESGTQRLLSNSKWTTYPSLLETIKDPDQRDALETAACASFCGRLRQAARLFNNMLPQTQSLPIFVLEKSRLLSYQSLEHDNIKLLETALEKCSQPSERDTARLMNLRLAMAQYNAYGSLKPALDVARDTRGWLSLRDRNNLTDIEVQIFLLYNTIVHSARSSSNWTEADDMNVFPRSVAKEESEIGIIRECLQKQGRLQQAADLWFEEMGCLEEDLIMGRLKEDIKTVTAVSRMFYEAFELCHDMRATHFVPLQLRSVCLALTLERAIKKSKPLWAYALKTNTVALLESVHHPFSTWQEFCPTLEYEMAKKAIISGSASEQDQLRSVSAMIQDALGRMDFTSAHDALQYRRRIAIDWVRASIGKSAEATARQHYRHANASLLEFHREQGLGPLSVMEDLIQKIDTAQSQTFRADLCEIKAFREQYPDFDVPDRLRTLLEVGIKLAQILGDVAAEDRFNTELGGILLDCSDWDRHGCDAVIPHVNMGWDWARNEIRRVDPDNHVLPDFARGNNAVKLVLDWAKEEWKGGLLRTEECQNLFGMKPEFIHDDFGTFLDNVDHQEVAHALLGTAKHNRHAAESEQGDLWSTERLARMLQMHDWLMDPERLAPLGERLSALSAMWSSKCNRSLRILTELDAPSPSRTEIEGIKVEISRRLMMAGVLPRHGKPLFNDGPVVRKLPNVWCVALMANRAVSRMAAPQDVATDEEILEAMTDCDEVIDFFSANARNQEACRTARTKIMLMMLRYDIYKIDVFDECLKELEKAETLLNRAKQAVESLDTVDAVGWKESMGRMSLPGDLYGQALNICLAGLRIAQDNATSSDKEINKMLRILSKWAIRSKGRIFSDRMEPKLEAGQEGLETELNLAKKIDDPMTALEDNSQVLRQIGQNDSALDQAMEISEGKVVTLPKLDHMLTSINKNVVIVDFICHNSSGSRDIAVILHRRDHQRHIIEYPPQVINLTVVEKWVARYLEDDGRVRARPLDDLDAGALDELQWLLIPLFMSRRFPASCIKQGETIVFCPTGVLHRIPLHAITVPGHGCPLIFRHAVSYCQSLTILYRNWQSYVNAPDLHNPTTAPEKGPVIICALPKEEGVISQVAHLADSLSGSVCFPSNYGLTKARVKDALNNTRLSHYFGHAFHDCNYPLDSGLLLDQDAYDSFEENGRPVKGEVLTTRDILGASGPRFRAPAVATVIGCASGVSTASDDDTLGLPAALCHAGASAVVSTLWPIDITDGANFATAFYSALERQDEASEQAEAAGSRPAHLNLTWAMHSAVEKLRGESDKPPRDPYHWAGFVLHGFWMID